MAIIGIIIALGLPALTSIGTSKGVTQAAYDISDLLEFARAEAVARQTYVWVGIKPERSGPNTVLKLGAVYAKDGTPTIAGNYQPLTRALTVSGVTLTNFAALNPATKATLTDQNLAVTAEASGNHAVEFQIGGVKFDANASTITFTPSGEAMLNGAPLPTDGFDPMIGIGLQQVHGTTTTSTANDAAVVLDGSVGIPLIVRTN